ncbi:monocarboxylate transporter [Holotrichia oblita]|uniref:Monocarboxylate transporter n=1 Tax=Holotrichia oblita TaxID=644536 RepID=A0ACB9SV36_HOLOL|nr:monocarboxylate transporter [Holotrichia oblita]
MINLPIAQSFGLVFKDRFRDLGFTATDTATIMNSSMCISMLSGLFNAALVRHFGYRKVALTSATLVITGLLLVAYANSFFKYLAFYGFITSLGMGMASSAYSFALNCYFRKNRGRAVGYAMTICGIGPIVMPQIFSILIEHYGTTGAVIIISGIAVNLYVSALLLQPIKWHMRKHIFEEVEEDNKLLEKTNSARRESESVIQKRLKASMLSLDHLDRQSVYGIDTSIGGSVVSLYSDNTGFYKRSASISSHRRFSRQVVRKMYQSDNDLLQIAVTRLDETRITEDKEEVYEDKVQEEVKQNTILNRIGKILVDTFDLSLLKDPIYINIMIGMSCAIFAEVNFSVLTPFIMQDFGLDTQQIASFMSTVSVADVCFRFVAPYVSEFFKQPSRIMYMCSLMLLIISRFTLLFTTAYYGLLCCAVFLGIAKGFRSVYWSLVIPEHVPIERLAAALGMQSTFNSILMWVGGSIIVHQYFVMVTKKLVPPDGGYGWVIMTAMAISNIITIPIAQGFGLIFKDRFVELGFSATDTALIMNTSGAISMFCGIFNGPLLKSMGYRKVALLSGCLTTLGVILTAQANSFLQYILTFGLITCYFTYQIYILAYGMGMAMSAYSLALNSYFREKRAKAMGYAMTVSGIGPIIMPQIFSFLVWNYGVSGAMTVVAGIATHTFASALLLQPIKWHMKEEIVEDVEENKELVIEEEEVTENNKVDNTVDKKRAMSLEDRLEVTSFYSSFDGSILSLYSSERPTRSMSMSSYKRPRRKNASADKINSISYQLQTRSTSSLERTKYHTIENDIQEQKEENNVDDTDSKTRENEVKQTIWKRAGMFLVDIFDLNLLRDPIFVNIMVGLSFAVFAEMNFSLLTPFIMKDYGLDTQQTATFMSMVSIADICFRFIAPYIFFVTCRSLLSFARMCLFLGVAKGFRTVYWSLVIPDYVPIERYAAASGMQSTFNSIFMWVGGSFIGYVRDVLGSFKYCIIAINCMTFITIIMWTIEIIYFKLKTKEKVEDEK